MLDPRARGTRPLMPVLHEGLEWLQQNQIEIVDRFIKISRSSDPDYYQELGIDYRRNIPNMCVEALIDRMESRPFPAERIKPHFIQRFEHGASLDEVTSRADLLLEAITSQINQKLTDRDPMKELLLNRSVYLVQLLKTVIASAYIEVGSK